MMDSAFAKMGFSTHAKFHRLRDQGCAHIRHPGPIARIGRCTFVSAEQFSALIGQLYEAAMDPG